MDRRLVEQKAEVESCIGQMCWGECDAQGSSLIVAGCFVCRRQGGNSQSIGHGPVLGDSASLVALGTKVDRTFDCFDAPKVYVSNAASLPCHSLGGVDFT
eukprot:617024-Karenia_brevis.AAC.1